MDSSTFFMYAGAAILGIIVWFLIIRWAHRITAKVDRLNASVLLLAEIAIKQGVSVEKVDSILTANEIER